MEGEGYMQRQQSALTVILKLAISGLTNIILIALGTVNLQFQGQLASISLRPFLEIVTAYVSLVVMQLTSSTWWGFQYL